MNDRKQDLKLENTAMALKKLDKAELEFKEDSDKLLESDLSGKEVNERFLQMLKELEQMKSFVRFAFYQDTKDRNCLDNCMIVSISWLREMVNDTLADAKDKAAVGKKFIIDAHNGIIYDCFCGIIKKRMV